MASNLAKDLQKFGLKAAKKETKSKSKMVTANAPKEIVNVVDNFLQAQSKIAELEAELAEAAAKIKDFALDNALKSKSMENVIIEAKEGSVNINFKDQYSLNSREELDAFLKSKKLDPDKFITEKTELLFDYNKMTEKEKKDLFTFVSKTMGQERFSQLVQDKTSYSIKGLKDVMPEVCKNREELDELRNLSKHYSPTVAKRTTKEE
jgi:hypothetical protein